MIKPKGDARYIRRDERGRIKESDDMGRSLKKIASAKLKKTCDPVTGIAATKSEAKTHQ